LPTLQQGCDAESLQGGPDRNSRTALIGGLAWWVNSLARHDSLDDTAVNAQIRIFDKYVLPASRLIDPLTREFFGQSLICIARKS
jgi:hypothetical protein